MTTGFELDGSATIGLSAIVQSAVTLVLVFAWMLVEARRAARNEQLQRARGGVEPAGDVYGWIRVAYPAVFLVMIAEGALSSQPVSALRIVAGLVVFVLGKALKWWAITTLGDRWTFRIVVVPGATPIASGPYRFLRHPNYVGVIGEIIGVALMTGARVTGPVSLVLYGALILRRVAVENRALDAILRRG